jgi:hypothetical protein
MNDKEITMRKAMTVLRAAAGGSAAQGDFEIEGGVLVEYRPRYPCNPGNLWTSNGYPRMAGGDGK